jgi:hypothetical protein
MKDLLGTYSLFFVRRVSTLDISMVVSDWKWSDDNSTG